MKKYLALILALVMCLCLFAACGNSEEAPADTSKPADTSAPADTSKPADQPEAPKADPVTLKVGYGLAEDTVLGIALTEYCEKVAEATEGRVNFEIYPNGQLGSLVEMIEAVDLGQLDVTMNDASLMTEYAPEANVLALPMLMNGYESWKNIALGEVGQELSAIIAEKSNMYVMGWIFNGFRQIISSVEVTSMDDCTGVIIRSPEADAYVQTLSRLNFTPTPLAFSEVYTALQTGVVQACETSYEQFILNSFYEEASHLVESNHMAASMSLIFNEEVWGKIDAADQAVMTEIYAEVFGAANDTQNELAEGYKTKLTDELGCDVYYYTADELAVISERMTSYWNENAAANGYEELLALALETR